MCGIKVEERKNFEKIGCCHKEVEEQFEKLLEGSILLHFLSNIKNQTDVDKWKEEICNQVSLVCMDTPKDKYEINEELENLILKKIFN